MNFNTIKAGFTKCFLILKNGYIDHVGGGRLKGFLKLSSPKNQPYAEASFNKSNIKGGKQLSTN